VRNVVVGTLAENEQRLQFRKGSAALPGGNGKPEGLRTASPWNVTTCQAAVISILAKEHRHDQIGAQSQRQVIRALVAIELKADWN